MRHLYQRSTLFPYTTLFRSKKNITISKPQDLALMSYFNYTLYVILFSLAKDRTELVAANSQQCGSSKQWDDQPGHPGLKNDVPLDWKSTRLNSSHVKISNAV